MDFDKVVKSRFSARKFYSKKPNWRDIIEAIESASKAPLAGGIPSVKFILVDDGEKINSLMEASQQDFIGDAHYAVVIISDAKDVIKSYDERGEIYARQQAGAAIEQFLLKLVDLGMGGCWVGAFVDDQVKRILQIPENVNVEAIIPIGYPFGRPLKRKHPNLDRIIYFNKYGQKQMKPKRRVEGL
ncbi:MAG TPA: nitroreductase family protein [Candidatus Nanoarchaeia archaeon]|nr:nitroreductase family protein [Candidatus Nanoarchaeia archaeon]